LDQDEEPKSSGDGSRAVSTKQAELLRVLFSMGLTAFIGAGTFVVIRYLTGLPE
jgi:hypothetical protein